MDYGTNYYGSAFPCFPPLMSSSLPNGIPTISQDLNTHTPFPAIPPDDLTSGLQRRTPHTMPSPSAARACSTLHSISHSRLVTNAVCRTVSLCNECTLHPA